MDLFELKAEKSIEDLMFKMNDMQFLMMQPLYEKFTKKVFEISKKIASAYNNEVNPNQLARETFRVMHKNPRVYRNVTSRNQRALLAAFMSAAPVPPWSTTSVENPDLIKLVISQLASWASGKAPKFAWSVLMTLINKNLDQYKSILEKYHLSMGKNRQDLLDNFLLRFRKWLAQNQDLPEAYQLMKLSDPAFKIKSTQL